MTDECSIWAYHDILESGYLGERQAMYLSVFTWAFPDGLTAWEATQQIEERFGKYFSKNGIGSRLSELERMGFLTKDSRTQCEKTGQTVNRWIYTKRKTPLDVVIETVCCPKCEGKGEIEIETFKEPETEFWL